MNYNKLATELHEAAVAKGFWDVEDALKKHVVKMLSELGEIVQADRADVMYEIEHDGAKPEGVAAEISDFVMMALDYCAEMDLDVDRMLLGIGYDTFREQMSGEVESMDVPDIVLLLERALSNLTDPASPNDLGAGLLAVCCSTRLWLEQRGCDLWEIIRLKMEYNKNRPVLHGRKY